MSFDSTQDTVNHVSKVREHLNHVIRELAIRAVFHDKSKLEEPEKSAFDSLGDNLKGLTYGFDEYRAQLKKIKPAIQHHYEHNSHHPEYWADGVNGMSLIDVLEMLCDWKAASERHNDGDIRKSIDHNKHRFDLSDQLAQILANTAQQLNWMD